MPEHVVLKEDTSFKNDDCWFHGGPLDPDGNYVEVVVCFQGHELTLVHRLCVDCAISHGFFTREQYNEIVIGG